MTGILPKITKLYYFVYWSRLRISIIVGNELTIVDACEDRFSDIKDCDDAACDEKCKQERGHFAVGRCKLVDTCFCNYPC